MQQNPDDRGAREAELAEVLSSYAEPRALGFRFVTGFVILGLLACGALSWVSARAPRRAPLRFEPEPTASFQRGVQAFRVGDWDEALRLVYEARSALRDPVLRVEDYIERLELIKRDDDRLARAEQALAESDPERALGLSVLIAPNSPLFAQAEGLGRSARAQLEKSAPTREAQESREGRSEVKPAAPSDSQRRSVPRRRRTRVEAPPAAGPDVSSW